MFDWFRNTERAAPSASASEQELTRMAADLLRAIPNSEPLAAKVRVRWNTRLTSTAGQARVSQSLIFLNPRLAEFSGELDRTLRHELAHLLAHWRTSGQRRKIAAHGLEWRQACTDLGIAGESRCHTLPLPRRQMQRRHAYRCPQCQYVLQRVKAIPKRRMLACRRCCQQHAGGKFDARFRFIKVELEAPAKRWSLIQRISARCKNKGPTLFVSGLIIFLRR